MWSAGVAVIGRCAGCGGSREGKVNCWGWMGRKRLGISEALKWILKNG